MWIHIYVCTYMDTINCLSDSYVRSYMYTHMFVTIYEVLILVTYM